MSGRVKKPPERGQVSPCADPPRSSTEPPASEPIPVIVSWSTARVEHAPRPGAIKPEHSGKKANPRPASSRGRSGRRRHDAVYWVGTILAILSALVTARLLRLTVRADLGEAMPEIQAPAR